MHRRELLIGAGSLITVSKLSFPKSAKAELRGVQAVNFNNTLLKNTSGAIPGMPTNGVKVFISFAFRTTYIPQNISVVLCNGSPDHQISCTFQNFGAFSIIITNNDGINQFMTWTPNLNAYNGQWHAIAMSVDPMNNQSTCAFDGHSIQPQSVQRTGSGLLYPNWLTNIKIGAKGVNVNGQLDYPYIGDLAQFQVRVGGPYINLNDPNILSKLYNTQDEEPIIIGTQGYLGDPMNVQSQIHMDGPPPMFLKNLAGHPFTWSATNSPFLVQTGTLGPATLDPWGFTGE